ncbi:MAG: transcription initiation factor IIB [Candidatus Nanohaloarchaeota archaeon QJJ-5]|nr:transcription initiation factor IIB [Candidatus Nanohaloarchaeota archaeon QJJ-5]
MVDETDKIAPEGMMDDERSVDETMNQGAGAIEQPQEVPNPAETPGPIPEEDAPQEKPESDQQLEPTQEEGPGGSDDDESDSEANKALKKANQQLQCPECDSTNFQEDQEKGELVCNNCGLVMDEDRVDESPEWRAFNAEQRDKKSRAGAPVTYTKHDMGVSTEIGKGSGELYNVSGKKRAQYYRMRKWHNRLTKSKDRNLGFALSELNRLVSHLNLPKSVHEEVARLYEKAVDKGLVRGRSMESVVASLIYVVSRKQGTPRTLDEISDASGIDKREIGRTYRYVARELDLRILPAKPQDHIPRFAGKLQLSGEVQARARKIIQEARDQNLLSGKGPTGIAAASLYIAAVLEGEKRTQREVADIVGVTEVTIRNRYKELVENLGLEDEIENKKD